MTRERLISEEEISDPPEFAPVRERVNGTARTALGRKLPYGDEQRGGRAVVRIAEELRARKRPGRHLAETRVDRNSAARRTQFSPVLAGRRAAVGV